MLGGIFLERCLLLSARRYDFNDDKGKRVAGVKVSYVMGDVDAQDEERGLAPLSINAPFELWPELVTLPGLYDVDFKQRPGANGKPTLQLVKVSLLQPLDFNKVLNGSFPANV